MSFREWSIRDLMTPDLKALEATASVRAAAELMRESDIGDVVVLENNRLCGIVTDRDIVVRVLADGSDPGMVTVGEICSRELTTVPPTASVDDAVRLIRQKAIRRLPVVEDDGEVLGIISIGDIAVAKDRESALADVSAAPPNT
jgi:CBS domain-containing protein